MGSQSCVPLSRLTLRLRMGTEGSSLALQDSGGALVPASPILWVEIQATPVCSRGWGFGRPGICSHPRLKYHPLLQLPSSHTGEEMGVALGG